MAGAETIISVRDLCNRFGSHVVHQRLDLEVRRGEVLGVVGGSGTGKSVLLRSIIGLQVPQSGHIGVFGHDVSGGASNTLKQRWGVLFQDGALFSSLSVLENVQIPMREQLGLPQALMDDLAALKLRMVGLDECVGAQLPSELSGGMRKRVGLARALALDPELLFLDEPTAGLDPIGAAAFDTLIRSLQCALGLTVFMVTHDLDSLYAICDRIAVLADGKVIAVDPVTVLEQHPHPWIQEYFRGPRSRASKREVE